MELDHIDAEYLDVLLWLFLVRARVLDLVHHIQALDGPAEDGVLVVEPRLRPRLARAAVDPGYRCAYRLFRRDEKLASVGVGSGVGHADRVRLVVLE